MIKKGSLVAPFSFKNIKVEVFPIDDGTALSEWTIEDSEKSVYFNNNYFSAQDLDTYNMNFNLFKFDSTELLIQDALPLVVMEIASIVQQKISDGDTFTLAGADQFNQFVRDIFIKEDTSDVNSNNVCVLPSFTRDDCELEPDLYRIFFVEAKDEDDGEDDFSDVNIPDGSLVLS